MSNSKSNQLKVLEKSAELWNAFLEIEMSDKHPDDNNEVRFHIHAIQNILYAQLYKKENDKDFVSQKF